MKRTVLCLTVFALIASVIIGFASPAKADAPLDEILEYRITIDVNEDATLTMQYHFDWKVLDSEKDGPLSWVKVGIPNSHYVSMEAVSSNITSLSYYEENGGCYARADLDRNYYEGEVVSFDFIVVQDYLYEMNRFTDGETYYEFTPGWFDAAVDKLVIKWNSKDVISVTPAGLLIDGYYTWERSLSPNQTFTVSATYTNDAYGFDDSKQIENDGSVSRSFKGENLIIGLIVGAVGFFVLLTVVGIIISFISKIKYAASANFGGGTSKKKITREKIVYHTNCPGCGASRPEGKDNCDYCGKSFIKSKETVTEEEVPEEIKDKDTEGTYHYGPDPNTFMRVHVVHLPVVTPSIFGSSSGSSRSSCAHSSCACAHSCACACACACAGGGRAGCTVKDFYNTGLKLEMLEQKKKKGSNNE